MASRVQLRKCDAVFLTHEYSYTANYLGADLLGFNGSEIDPENFEAYMRATEEAVRLLRFSDRVKTEVFDHA